MGCDIHTFIEKKVEKRWFNIKRTVLVKYYDSYFEEDYYGYNSRNYNLFAVLADVRNGRGFAGCDTGNRLNPIAQPRGIPEDASGDVKEAIEQYGGDGHSHSYHTLTELLAYNWDQERVSRGYITLEQLQAIQAKKKLGRMSPKSWSGDVSGGLIKKISMAEALVPFERDPSYTYYVQYEWKQPLREMMGDFLQSLEHLKELANEEPKVDFDNVRMVFFFDN